MLRLYVDTLIVGHKHCNVLRLLTEIELQREWQHFVTNHISSHKKTKHQQNKHT